LAIAWLDQDLNLVVLMPTAETDDDKQARADICATWCRDA